MFNALRKIKLYLVGLLAATLGAIAVIRAAKNSVRRDHDIAQLKDKLEGMGVRENAKSKIESLSDADVRARAIKRVRSNNK